MFGQITALMAVLAGGLAAVAILWLLGMRARFPTPGSRSGTTTGKREIGPSVRFGPARRLHGYDSACRHPRI